MQKEIIQAFNAVELYKIYPEGMNLRNYSSRKAMVIQMIDEIILSNEAMVSPHFNFFKIMTFPYLKTFL